MIDEKQLLDFIKNREAALDYLILGCYGQRELNLIKRKIIELAAEPICNMYDKEETIENCTVQILSNSVTGDVSVGWWHWTEEELRQV